MQGYTLDRDDRNLTRRERDVLDQADGLTQNVEIARRLGVSKQRVTQLVDALVNKGAAQRDQSGYVVRSLAEGEGDGLRHVRPGEGGSPGASDGAV